MHFVQELWEKNANFAAKLQKTMNFVKILWNNWAFCQKIIKKFQIFWKKNREITTNFIKKLQKTVKFCQQRTNLAKDGEITANFVKRLGNNYKISAKKSQN